MYQAILFDFDYTLGDSTNGIVLCVNYGLTQLGYRAQDKEAIRKTIGLSLKDTLFQLTGDQNETHINLFKKYFREKSDEVMVANTVLFPPVKEVLLRLKEQGYKIGIVTTKFHYRIEQILSKFDLCSVPDIIVGAEDVKVEKPNPEGLLYAIHHLNAELQNVLYVGDSLVDAETAARANVDFAGVLTGTTTAIDFAGFPNVLIAKDLDEIFENKETSKTGRL